MTPDFAAGDMAPLTTASTWLGQCPDQVLCRGAVHGEQEDPVWNYAEDILGAIQLARAREQHELSYVMYYRRVDAQSVRDGARSPLIPEDPH